MRLPQSAFAVISVISFLWTLAIFIAGSLIFLNIQIYNSLLLAQGMCAACVIIIAEVSILFSLFLLLIRHIFFNIFRARKKPIFRIGSKAFLGLAVYELLKLYYKKKQKIN